MSFFICSLIICERVGKNNCWDALLYAQSFFRPIYIFNNYAYFLDFRAQNLLFPQMMYQTIHVQGRMQTVQIQIRLLLLQPKAYRKTSVKMSK